MISLRHATFTCAVCLDHDTRHRSVMRNAVRVLKAMIAVGAVLILVARTA